MRILVVENEGGDADLMQRELAAEGYAVVLASDTGDGERRACGIGGIHGCQPRTTSLLVERGQRVARLRRARVAERRARSYRIGR